MYNVTQGNLHLEVTSMSLLWKWGYMKVMYVRYYQAKGRKAKTAILDEFCRTYDCHRKHALRLLNGLPPGDKRPVKKKRTPLYSNRVISIIKEVWKASGYLWSKRLKVTIVLWMPWIKERFTLSPQEHSQLLSISSAQIDRRLKSVKQWFRKKVFGSTKRGPILKHQIPVKTDSWHIKKPGYVETDLVSHCGGSASGDFAHTVNWTDIATQWVERRAILGKAQEMVFLALKAMRHAMPFDLCGLDSDNGSEFINFLLYNYCLKNHIAFTRSRPYKKDDNAHIEQKNWTHVRQLLGYLRYDTQEVVDAINDLYTHELRIFQNFFQPSVKLIKKIRIGSKVKKIYDAPATPFQRLITLKKGNPLAIKEFQRAAQQYNPFELSAIIDHKLEAIYAMASKTPRILMPHYRFSASAHPALGFTNSHLFPDVDPKSPLPLYSKIFDKEKALQTW
jgi:hypothetical protein